MIQKKYIYMYIDLRTKMEEKAEQIFWQPQVWRWFCPAFCFFSSDVKETKNKEIKKIKKDEIRNRQKYFGNPRSGDDVALRFAFFLPLQKKQEIKKLQK